MDKFFMTGCFMECLKIALAFSAHSALTTYFIYALARKKTQSRASILFLLLAFLIIIAALIPIAETTTKGGKIIIALVSQLFGAALGLLLLFI